MRPLRQRQTEKTVFGVLGAGQRRVSRRNVLGAAITVVHIREGNKETMNDKNMAIYNFNAIEKKWQQNWEASKTFKATDCDTA